jgi:hypothetical protein
MLRYRAALAALGLAFSAGQPLAGVAATTGLAWDSVTKIEMSADQSSLQPGSFDSDYAAAAAAQPPASTGGGIFAKVKQAMATGQNMQQMMQTGFAAHHYIAGTKERTDDVTMQTATIIDCAARTITTLDLRNKTYRVVSMDQPQAPSSGSGGSHSNYSDNGGRVAITISNTALGPLQVAGQSTNGYRSDMTITETSSTGESHTQNGNLVGYYTSLDEPVQDCSRFAPAPSGGAPGAGMMAGYARIMRALASTGANSRFSVKQSGPSLPLGKLAMYDAFTFGMQGRAATFVTERGNVRTITADDPVFSIPAGFTQQQ